MAGNPEYFRTRIFVGERDESPSAFASAEESPFDRERFERALREARHAPPRPGHLDAGF